MLCLMLFLILRRRNLMRRHQEALTMHDEVPSAFYIHIYMHVHVYLLFGPGVELGSTKASALNYKTLNPTVGMGSSKYI